MAKSWECPDCGKEWEGVTPGDCPECADPVAGPLRRIRREAQEFIDEGEPDPYDFAESVRDAASSALGLIDSLVENAFRAGYSKGAFDSDYNNDWVEDRLKQWRESQLKKQTK